MRSAPKRRSIGRIRCRSLVLVRRRSTNDAPISHQQDREDDRREQERADDLCPIQIEPHWVQPVARDANRDRLRGDLRVKASLVSEINGQIIEEDESQLDIRPFELLWQRLERAGRAYRG